MKYLISRNQTIEEFNEILKEGIKNGLVLHNANDINIIIELAYNLDYFLTYFKNAADIYGKKESYNN